jgi:hypothetical protein
MLSAPTASTSAAPSRTACAAETAACRPLPHRRLTPSAVLPTLMPIRSAAWRGRNAASGAVCSTLPATRASTFAASTRAKPSAARAAAEARSVADCAFSRPLKEPKGLSLLQLGGGLRFWP